MASARLSTVVLDAPDAHALAGFYLRLLGYVVRAEEPDRVLIGPPGGGTALSFQTEPAYVPPVWPAPAPGGRRMMPHLDIEVDDLASETARALAEARRWPRTSRRPMSGSCWIPPGTPSACGPGRRSEPDGARPPRPAATLSQ
ncbi:glyoxalase [Streptomyces sp. 1-11]|nr:glyoxalase [Streptomyces sp. 1-11]